jgi:hypothetical protein
LHVPIGRLVEGRRDHLGLHVLLHVGDLFRSFVDEEHDQRGFGVILGDRVGDLLENDGLAGLGRRHDETALAESHRREQVHHAGRQVPVLPFEANPPIRVSRPEVVEPDPVLRLLRIVEVDLLDFQERQVALALLGRPHLPEDRVTGPEIEPLDLARAHIDVVRPVQVVPVLAAEEPVPFGKASAIACSSETDFFFRSAMSTGCELSIDEVGSSCSRMRASARTPGARYRDGEAWWFFWGYLLDE